MSEISRSALEFSRRRFLKASGTLTGGFVLGAFPNPADAFDEDKASDVALVELPKGAAPRPLSFPYFPDRLHTFVWRNWPLVPAVRMASVVGARTADIERIARAMGLGKAPKISREQEARSYITVIKRNWNLL